MSKNKHLLDPNFDPLDQLDLLKKKCNNISSYIYSANSLYLEEVRKVLPQAIRTSILSLITDRLVDDFGFSTVESRKRFQLKIDKLVSDTISILTIEHLNELAKKIEEENIRHLNNAKDEMSNALNMKNIPEKSEALNDVNSIIISSILPLENLSITEGWNGELKVPYSVENKESYIKSAISDRDCRVENT